MAERESLVDSRLSLVEEILATDLHGIDTDLKKDFFTTKTRRHEEILDADFAAW